MTPLEIAADPETTAATWRQWLYDQLGTESPDTRENVRGLLLHALAEVSAAYSKLLVECENQRADMKDLYNDLREAQNRYDDPE